MLVKEKTGNLENFDRGQRSVDFVEIEWFETNKRILHKQSNKGEAVTLKSLDKNPDWADGDILDVNDSRILTIHLIDCSTIVIRPQTMHEMATICYEIGNKHLPLFINGEELLVPFERPLLSMLQACGYNILVEERRLTTPLKTTVLPHAHAGGGTSLFTKIMTLTS